MMTGGFNYCNGRPCKFTQRPYGQEPSASNGYLLQWIHDQKNNDVYGLIEDTNGYLHTIKIWDIQLLSWYTTFKKEEQPDES